MNAVDTNVLVYFVDHDEPMKRNKASQLFLQLARSDVETVLLWQVAAEFLSCLRRWEQENRIVRKQTLGHLERLEAMFRWVLPTPGILRNSLELSSRYSLSHWDSMLLAACIETNVTTLIAKILPPAPRTNPSPSSIRLRGQKK